MAPTKFSRVGRQYDGKFDEGWEVLRTMTFAKQKNWDGYLRMRYLTHWPKPCRNGLMFQNLNVSSKHD